VNHRSSNGFIGDCEFGSAPAITWEHFLPDYRLYIVGHDGHFQSSIAIPDCPDDDAAITATKPLIDGHDVELWHADRKVGVFDHKTKSVKSA
jgi:hypothetical protein